MGCASAASSHTRSSSRDAALKPRCAAEQKGEGHRYYLWDACSRWNARTVTDRGQGRGACYDLRATVATVRGAPLATGGYGNNGLRLGFKTIEFFFSCCVLVVVVRAH